MEFQTRFTEREKEVIQLLLQGKSNKQIAMLLNISKSTVEFHLKHIYLKLGASSRTEAVLNLSKGSLGESAGRRQTGDLRQSTGQESTQSVYSSQAKHFFDPKEEKAMKNRTMISIILSVTAILIALGVLEYLQKTRFATITTLPVETSSMIGQTLPANTSQGRSRGVLEVSPDASTRQYDEILLLLRTPNVPFHYAGVFAGVGCFVPDEKTPCAFTAPIPYTDGEWPDGPVSWRPDGEYGFYSSGNEILVIDHLERLNGKSDVVVPNIPITQSAIFLSPDGRWIVESAQRDDPYASDLVLIKSSSTGRFDTLEFGLNECFKTPIGWTTPTEFLFRCEVFTGATSKKFLSEVRYYTYDVLSQELLEFKPEMKIGLGFGPLSPNGKYLVFAEKQGDLQIGNLQVMDLSSSRVYLLNIHDGQVIWSHDFSKVAIFADNGDIFVSNYDGSNQKKIYSSNAPGYLSMEWFPDDKYIAIIGSFNSDPKESEMIVLSINGDVIHYNSIPTTDGYDIVGVSPLPLIHK